jgi:uncharacterized protein
MAKHKLLRIVIDTNWYISASINRTSRRKLFSVLSNPKIAVFYSDELLDEYKRVITRKKFASVINTSQANRFIRLTTKILIKAEVINKTFSKSRDIKDNYLLSLSESCNAHFLITGDDDLLVLQKHVLTKIITFAEFLMIQRKIKE